MTDVLGWRAKFGVLGPSTNTIVQPEFDAMRVPGVTNHYSRIIIENANAVSDETFIAGTLIISDNTLDAVRGVLTCSPDYLVMGMSAVTFYDGAEGARKWRENIEEASGLQLSIGSESCVAAMQAYGSIERIVVISPYFPAANREVIRFFADYGFQTLRDCCLRCPTWTAIAEVTEATLRQVVAELDGDDVDAIVQVGTNLCMLELAAELERELHKPVIAINAATYWHALRQFGIEDQLQGYGLLLEKH